MFILNPRAFWAAILTSVLLLPFAGPAAAQMDDDGLVVPYVDAELPIDPAAGMWDDAPPVTIGLTAQTLTIPWGGGHVTEVEVRGLHNGRNIAFLMSWADPAPEMDLAAGDAFGDAAAIQFPVEAGVIPSPFMGDEVNPVNIWQWQAAWQRDIDEGALADVDRVHPPHGAPYADEVMSELGETSWRAALAAGNWRAMRERATPVENTISAGFNTLATLPQQPVQGRGEWEDGRWKVVFQRAFDTGHEGDAGFEVGGETSFNVAVWDGASGDRGGQKSVSLIWRPLEIGGPPRPAVEAPVAVETPWWPFAMAGLAMIGLALAVFRIAFIPTQEQEDAS